MSWNDVRIHRMHYILTHLLGVETSEACSWSWNGGMLEISWMIASQRWKDPSSTVACSNQPPSLQMKITLWVSQSSLAPIEIHNHHVEIPNKFLEFLQCPTNTVSRPFECDSTSLSRYSASQTTKPFNQPSWHLTPLGQSAGEVITIQMHVERLPLSPRPTW